MEQQHKTQRSEAAAVVDNADTYRSLRDIAALADAKEGIRQGLEEARKGKGRPVREFFAEFKTKHGISG